MVQEDLEDQVDVEVHPILGRQVTVIQKEMLMEIL